MKIPAWFVGRDGLNKYTNPAACKLLGTNGKDINGLKWADYMHPEERQAYLAHAMSHQSKGLPYQCRTRMVKACGCEVEVDVHSGPMYDRDGNWVGHMGMMFPVADACICRHHRRLAVETLN